MKANTAGLIYLSLICLSIFHNSIAKKRPRRDLSNQDEKQEFLLSKKSHKLKELNVRASKQLAIDSDYESFHRNYLQNILRVRVPGTVGHHEVKMFIINKLKEFGWHVELDEFEQDTVLKKKKFTNIIGILNPKADRRLALAAHYDSKLVTPKNGRYFLGATDSAVPCAMLLDFAKTLADKYKNKPNACDAVTPMIVFLDGEEAFVEWTEEDSIYGARHLASTLQVTPHHNEMLAQQKISALDSLDAFVLFDLIGANKTQFLDMFPSATSKLYNSMKNIETKLRSDGVISRRMPYFAGQPRQPVYVEDDHIPFLKKGVRILHLISVPFPKEWHTLDDDESCLNPTIISELLVIFRRFLVEYFQFD